MERYQKVKNIGKGGMGQCILVRRRDDGQQFIMKLIDLSKMNKKERTASLHEAKVLSSLNHPNVIRYVDSFLSPKHDQLCIVMEWAEGGDLSAKVKSRKKITEDQLLDWFVQICLAVQYCHKKRVFHRDIKTQNIFLSADGVIKLGDFGISRVLQNTGDCAHTFIGTPYYLSPELIQERPYNTASDIWALGVVLYELMALRMPFNANDMKGLMYKIMRVIYDPPPLSFSSDLRGLVPRMLVKDPKSRLTAKDLLAQPVVAQTMKRMMSGASNVPEHYIQSLLEDMPGGFDNLSAAPVRDNGRKLTEQSSDISSEAPPKPGSRQRRGSLLKPQPPQPAERARRSSSLPPLDRAVPKPKAVGRRDKTPEPPAPALKPAGIVLPSAPSRWDVPKKENPIEKVPPSNKLPAILPKIQGGGWSVPVPPVPPAENPPGRGSNCYRAPYRRNLVSL
mmetsp:Transcript_132070/g.228937  ORF Transcript_132070/g.228937 Transcript_132070/m.228937 type:complete len:449 (-) Transcript_132070:1234-2580(-)